MALNLLSQWIADEHASGRSPESIARNLLEMGWHAEAARTLLASVLQDVPRGTLSDLHDVPLPGTDLDVAAGEMVLHGARMHLRMFVRHPRIALLDGFLSEDECDEVIACAHPRLGPSMVYDVADAETTAVATYGRQSQNVMFDEQVPAVIQRLEQRAALLLQWPLDRFEATQVVRYLPGEEFEPHHDFFELEYESASALMARGGNRVGTLLLYLNTPERGGATVFSDIQLEVVPRRGSALFFAYGAAHAQTLTLHAGAPVVCGEKWLASMFLREGMHRGMAADER